MVYDWKKDGKNWYYLGDSNSGAMQTGWVLQNSKWYYLDKTTGAMKTGWAEIDSKWYYFDATGAMKTGWK